MTLLFSGEGVNLLMGHVGMLLLPELGISLLLDGLLGGLGLGTGHLLLGGGLDDSYGDGLPHVTDGEATEGREVGEGFHAHGLGGLQADDTGVSGLDELGSGFGCLTGTTIHLL